MTNSETMVHPIKHQQSYTINCQGTLIDLSTPIVMGILNVTTDSFYDGGTFVDEKSIVNQVGKMLDEGATIIDVGAASSRHGSDITPEDKFNNFINLPTYDRSVEKYINPYRDNWQMRYYKSLFDINIDDHRRKQICVNYLEGLEWNIKYYTSGCPDWKWCYKYSYPPLLCDLINYIPYFDTEFVSNKPEQPVSELVQLCYVLPRQSLQYLPDKLYKSLIAHKLNWYNINCDFHWAYCKYFWESHPNLPFIDVAELESFVEQNKNKSL
jgi:5'-3' exonuclease